MRRARRDHLAPQCAQGRGVAPSRCRSRRTHAMNEPIYIIDGARTPFLKARNRPGPFAASDLATAAGRALLVRQPFAPADLDEVILGCAAPSPDEVNIGRVVALRMGCGQKVPGWTVMRNCASGMQALDSAIDNIRAGRSNLVLAGGVDALSRAPLLFSDAMVLWLSNWYAAKTLGQRARAARQVQARLSRAGDRADEGPDRSDRRPADGADRGEPRVPLRHHAARDGRVRRAQPPPRARGAAEPATSTARSCRCTTRRARSTPQDDGVRDDSTAENLAKLRPFFDRKYGNVTAGNSSQITDGAAWLVLASERAVRRSTGSTPKGRIVDSEWAGLDPGADGTRAGARGDADPAAARPRPRRPRRVGDQRGVRRAGDRLLRAWTSDEYCRNELGLDARAGRARRGEAQRRRRRDRARPPGRRVGRAHRAARR